MTTTTPPDPKGVQVDETMTVGHAPTRLRTDYLEDQAAWVDAPPRLSWWPNDDRDEAVQTAYQVQAATSAEALAAEPDLWDSGFIESDRLSEVAYGGRLPAPMRATYWRVRTFDADGLPSPWSDPARFVCVQGVDNWQGVWIGGDARGNRMHGGPSQIFRRKFSVADLSGAVLRLSVAGAANVEINGQDIGCNEMSWVDFHQRMPVRYVDVSAFVREGENVMTVVLGDGYYTGAADGQLREHYGTQTGFRAELHLWEGSDAHLVIATDDQWRLSQAEALAADPLLGESIDGRRQFEAVYDHAFDDVLWQAALQQNRPDLPEVLRSKPSPANEVVAAAEIRRLPNSSSGFTRWRVEFERCVFGRPRIGLNGQPGQFLRVRCGVDAEDTGRWTDDYTLAGREDEVFSPRFSTYYFRWLVIEGDLASDGLTDVSAVDVSSALAPVSTLETDHPLLNTYVDRAHRTVQLLLQDVPLAGTALAEHRGAPDALYAALESLPFAVDVAAYLRVWVDDVTAACAADGRLPLEVPRLRRQPVQASISAAAEEVEPDTQYADFVIGAAWAVYRAYGDVRVLARVFPVAKRLLTALASESDELVRTLRFDRLVFNDTRDDLIGTALFYETARTSVRIAAVLGRFGEMEELNLLAGRVRNAFRRRFLSADGLLVSDTPTAMTLALALDLVEGEEISQLVDRLGAAVRENGYHHVVEPFAAAKFLEVLMRFGLIQDAYACVLQTGENSWLDEPPGGLGTTPPPGESGTTHLYGIALLGWMFRHLVGLQNDAQLTMEGNAFRRATVHARPPIGDAFAEGAPITSVAASFDSTHGRYSVSWQIAGRELQLNVTVPAGCVAQVVLSEGEVVPVVAGEHEFRLPLVSSDDGIPVLQDSLTH